MPGEYIDKKRILGFVLFTVLYIFSLISYNKFLSKTPEAARGIYVLAVMSTLVYAVGLVLLLKLKRN
ncbi:MAG: hypothetical protein F7B78_06355 [Desulfurococcales archaeon]|nr:hypothetical protein [Desulfurococcales archaeon]